MGVDVSVKLPASTRVRDAAEVLGMLLGHPGSRRELGSGCFSADVEGVSVETYPGAALIGCARIILSRDGTPYHDNIMWHFEGDTGGCDGGRLISLGRSRGIWIACGLRLVEFFGGQLCYRDYDDGPWDIDLPPRYPLAPCDGEEWQQFQDAILAVTPITTAEEAKAEQYAAYSVRDWRPPTPWLDALRKQEAKP